MTQAPVRSLSSLWRRVGTRLPGFIAKGRSHYQLGDIFGRVLNLEAVGDRFAISHGLVPLYVPTSYWYVSYGGRLHGANGNERWWAVQTDMTDALQEIERLITEQVKRHWARIATVEAFADYLSTFTPGLRQLEAMGLSAAWLGEIETAREAFRRMSQCSRNRIRSRGGARSPSLHLA